MSKMIISRTKLYFLLCFLIVGQALAAQLYYKSPFSELQSISITQNIILANGQDLTTNIYAAYSKQIRKQQIAVVDSVFVVFKTDENGKVSTILNRGGFVRTYINILEKELKRAKFTQIGVHKLALVFNDLNQTGSYNIWEVDEVPLLESCKRINKQGNELYARAGFSYAAEEKIRDLEKPSAKKKKLLQGQISARIVVSPNGLVCQIDFDSTSTNPDANDYFMYQLYLVNFPKGVKKYGQPVNYHLDYTGGYFLSEEKQNPGIDTTITYEFTLHTFDPKTNTYMSPPYPKAYIDSLPAKQYMLEKHHVGDINFSFWQKDLVVVAGPYVGCNVGSLPVWPANLYFTSTPMYPENLHISLPVFGDCNAALDNKVASICSSQKIIEHIQNQMKYSLWQNKDEIKRSKIVLIIDDEGKVVKQQVIGGNFLAKHDLECLSALSELPALLPASIAGKNVTSMITVIITKI